MEPVFMILGQSAGTIASMSIEKGNNIHDLPYNELKTKLESSGQVLESD